MPARLHMDAVLTPTRSLPRAGLFVLLAFHVSYRQARRRERVQVSADEISVHHEVGAQSRTVWRSPTAFTRVAIEDRHQSVVKVTLMLSRRRLVVAGQVSPQERMDFADALEAAIKSARAERHPS